MNSSIQKEIAAPQDCKKNLWLISIAFVNLLILALSFTLLEIMRRNFAIDSEYVNASYFMGIIVAIGIIAAVLLRKYHTLMLTVLTLTAIDSAALMIYYNALAASGSLDIAWRMLTIIFSFAILIFALLFIGIYYAKPRERNVSALSATRYLTYCAMLTAISVICKMIGNAITATIPFAGQLLKPTVVYIPWVLSGIILGPIGGFATAAIGDFLGQLAVSTGGMPLPALTLSNGLFSVFPALVYKLVKHKNVRTRALIAVVLGTALSSIICTLGISTYTLYSNFFSGGDKTFAVYFVSRLPQLLIIGLNVILMVAIINPLTRSKTIKQPVTKFFD